MRLIKGFSESMHRPKLVNWNESVDCTPIDRAFKKCDSTRGQALFYNQPFLIHGSFSKINCAVFGQNKCKNIRFWKIFRHKTRVFCLQKYKKIQLWVQWLYNIYLTKAKTRTPSLFAKTTQM